MDDRCRDRVPRGATTIAFERYLKSDPVLLSLGGICDNLPNHMDERERRGREIQGQDRQDLTKTGTLSAGMG